MCLLFFGTPEERDSNNLNTARMSAARFVNEGRERIYPFRHRGILLRRNGRGGGCINAFVTMLKQNLQADILRQKDIKPENLIEKRMKL